MMAAADTLSSQRLLFRYFSLAFMRLQHMQHILCAACVKCKFLALTNPIRSNLYEHCPCNKNTLLSPEIGSQPIDEFSSKLLQMMEQRLRSSAEKRRLLLRTRCTEIQIGFDVVERLLGIYEKLIMDIPHNQLLKLYFRFHLQIAKSSGCMVLSMPLFSYLTATNITLPNTTATASNRCWTKFITFLSIIAATKD